MNGRPIFLDYDDTCFDTKRLKPALFSFLASLGFSRQLVEATYAEARRDPRGYAPDQHAERLIQLVAGKRPLAAAVLRSRYVHRRAELTSALPDFVYPDARDFVRDHLEQTRILTIGEPSYQDEKVAALGMNVPVMACSDDEKADVLAAYFEGQGIGPADASFVFIDNLERNVTQVRERFPQATAIHLNRNPSGQAEATSFSQINPG